MRPSPKFFVPIGFVGLLVVAIVLFVFTPLFLSGESAANRLEVTVDESGFHPDKVKLKVSGQVIFKNSGQVDHWPASNDHPTHRAYPGSDIAQCETDQKEKLFDACGNIEPGETYSFTFNEPGTWKYHDHLFSQLSGTVVVKGGSTVASTNDFPIIPIAVIVASLIAVFVGYKISRKPFKFSLRLPKRGSKLFYLLVFSPLLFLLPVIFFWLTTDKQDTIDKVPVWLQDKQWQYDDSIGKDSTLLFNDENAQYSYVKKFGFEATVERLQNLESEFGDCHNSAHETGRIAYVIYANDVFKSHAPECHSGGIHGATEAFFAENGTENLQEKLKVICAGIDNSFFNHQCVHGIGYGLMAWTNYEIHEALETCDFLGEGKESCYSGVYMENIVGGLVEEYGHHTQYLSDDPHFPCNVVNEKYVSACYYYQTSIMAQLFDGDLAKLAKICNEAPDNSKRLCFQRMGRDVGGANRNSPKDAINVCSVIQESGYRTDCLIGAVQDYFWVEVGQDPAIEFCKLLKISSEKEACYGTIIARAQNVLDSEDTRKQFCGKIEDTYKQNCYQLIN